MSPGEEKRGITRERLAQAALELISEEGIESLSMRALADALVVKAASLYWHVRDRQDLLELLAGSILDGVQIRQARTGWRTAVRQTALALADRVAGQRDAGRLLLEVPEALQRSDVFSELKRQLEAGGLRPGEAAEVALMVMVHVITARIPAGEAPAAEGSTASIAVDSGSTGVVLRAGTGVEDLARPARDAGGVSPAIVRGETVTVRRLRGVGKGEVELDSGRAWKFKIQAPTWNTLLDARGLDVREIHIDSGATKVECFLSSPRGVVPIHISSGVVGVSIHRPRGAAVVARVHTGAVKIKLDDHLMKVAVSDVLWESERAASKADRYELDISSGAVQVTLDERVAPPSPIEVVSPPMPVSKGEQASALEILLDGVEALVKSRS